MSTRAEAKTEAPRTTTAPMFPRILQEGYGPGSWHGADLKAALADVDSDLAFWRPQPERHNIAEIALHHGYQAHAVRGKLGGRAPEAFPVEGEDWFAAAGPAAMSWDKIRALVETEQQRLAATVAELATGRSSSTLPEAEQLELVLGITCHAVYHAGQVQLIKRLRAEQAS